MTFTKGGINRIKFTGDLIECIECHVINERNQYQLNPTGTIKNRICKKCRIERLKKCKKKTYKDREIKPCNRCGFLGHRCQMDIHHLDGNHKNNSPENRVMLCANCHRMTHFEELK